VSKAGWLGQVGLDPRRRFKQILVFEFQGFLEFDRTWRNFTRRVRRNLDMGILPKFF
jgi:hypothetical protein